MGEIVLSKEIPFVTKMIDPGTGRQIEVRTQIELPKFAVYKVGKDKWVCAVCGGTLKCQDVPFDVFGGDPNEPFAVHWFVCLNGCIPKPPPENKRKIMIITEQVCSIQLPSDPSGLHK